MGIQPTSTYTALSLITNSPQQRQTSASATATFTASATSLADKTTISQAARNLAAQESNNTHSDAPHAADRRFPPASAPANVQAAWAEATQGMSDLERVSAEGAFMAEEISANLKYDSTGRAIGIRQHGEPGYVDLWNQPGMSYAKQVDLMLEKLEQNQSAYTAKDYALFRDVLTGFRAALSNG